MKPENKFFSFMSLIGDIILLNVLFLITSIPLITIGASTTALYASLKKRIHGHESYIIKDYITLWAVNFKNATIIWCVLLCFLSLLCLFTGYVAGHLEHLLVVILYCVLFLVFAVMLIYVFPLQATFINTPFTLLRNSLLTGLAHLPHTLLLIFTLSMPVCITLCFPRAFFFTGAYWLLAGFSLSSLWTIFITDKVFQHYI